MDLKIWNKVGEFKFHFQNSNGKMCFWKIMLKVRCFKKTSDHRPFLSKFYVKLGSWGIIHTGEHSPLEVSTKASHLPPGSSAGFTPRARSTSFYIWKNVHNNYLMGLIVSTSLRVAPTKIRFLIGIWIFKKSFQK